MRALIDADSLVYMAYHVNKSKFDGQDLVNEIVFTAEAMLFNIMDEAERQSGFDINDYQFFFTTCTKNFRNDIAEDYKANRVEQPKELYDALDAFMFLWRDNYGVHFSETLEADDLIPQFIKTNGLKVTEYIIVRIDQDLAQIEGFHFNYYKNREGSYKGLSYIGKREAFRNFCKLILIGDSSDNIKGAKGVGDKTSDKLLKDRNEFGMWREVVKSYLKEEAGKERLKKNIQLMRLY